MSKFNYEKERLQHLAKQTASKYGLDPDLFLRQINQESGFNPKARSGVGAIGLGQIMPATAKGMGLNPADLLNPEKNLDAAAKIMQRNLKTYNNDYTLALAAYNGGGGAVNFVRDKLGRMPTGQEWVQHMSERRKKKGNDPSAWHTQTLNYVNNIVPQQRVFAQESPKTTPKAEQVQPVSQGQQSGTPIPQQVNPDILNSLVAHFGAQNQGIQENQQAIQSQQVAMEELRRSLMEREIAQREMSMQSQQHQQMLNQQAQQKAQRDNLLASGISTIQSLQGLGNRQSSPIQLGYQDTQNYTPKFQQEQANPWINMS
jgi:aryl carrier-like protein